jgi:hypothetical protein
MIAFTVDPDWYCKYWNGESRGPGDVDHCAILKRWAILPAARALRRVAAGFSVVLGIAVRKQIGEHP